jgi:hypothetical protein
MQNLWALPAGASGLLVKDSPATSRSRLLCAVAVFVAAMHADAITIDRVTHFQYLTRPADGVLYSFATLVDFTIDPGDFAGGFLPIVFRDVVLPNVIHYDAVQINVQPGLLAGTQELAAFRYMIGCTNSPTPEVKGPLGSISNDAAIGEYFFPTLKTSTGSTHIDCIVPQVGFPPGEPTNEEPAESTPQPPSYDPYRRDLLPLPYLNADGSPAIIVQAVVVPEPADLGWAVGVFALGLGVIRRKLS